MSHEVNVEYLESTGMTDGLLAKIGGTRLACGIVLQGSNF